MATIRKGQTGAINLKDDDPPTVRRMISYLYTPDYVDIGDSASVTHYMQNGNEKDLPISEDDAGRQAQLMNNVAVYAIVDKYGIPKLKELAKTKFKPLLLCAHLTSKIPIFVNAIFETTPSTDPGLREVAIEFRQSHVRTILNDSHSSDMLKDHAELSLGVMGKMAHEHVDLGGSNANFGLARRARRGFGLRRRLERTIGNWWAPVRNLRIRRDWLSALMDKIEV